MTDPAEGSGDVKTYITGTNARTTVDADLRLHVPPPPVTDIVMTAHSAGFEMEDYLVVEGIPTAIPPAMVRLRSRCGIGEYFYTDAPPAPSDVDIGATMRWLPTDESFSPDGSAWTPTIGGGLRLTASLGPYLDPFYSFEVRGGDEVELPAVIFDGDAGMTLSDTGWSATAFTFLLVAVMHNNPEGSRFSVFESYQPPEADPSIVIAPEDGSFGSSPIDWGLRYNQGVLQMWAGGTIVSHQISFLQGRPVLLAVSMDTETGRLFICDRTKSTRSFSTAGFALFDIQLLLGQSSDGLPNQTAYMDVLDFAYYDRALDFTELNEVLSDLDSVYGIVH